jgi:hypothetical protein
VSDVPLVPPPIIKIVGFVLFNNFLCGGSIRGFCSAVHLQRQCVCREIPAAQYFVESEIVGCKWVCIQVRKKTPMDAHLKIYHADCVLRTFINGSRMSFRKTITYFREFLERQIQILQVRRFSTWFFQFEPPVCRVKINLINLPCDSSVRTYCDPLCEPSRSRRLVTDWFVKPLRWCFTGSFGLGIGSRADKDTPVPVIPASLNDIGWGRRQRRLVLENQFPNSLLVRPPPLTDDESSTARSVKRRACQTAVEGRFQLWTRLSAEWPWWL